MNKRDSLMLLAFGLILVAFAILSSRVGFHDSLEYINMAKALAGIKNVPLFSTHPIVYPLIIAFFLKIWPSFIMIKLVNTLWVFLIALVLYSFAGNRKAFVLFIFSPIVWYVSIQTTPILPATFFFLLTYLFYKNSEFRYGLLLSGICLGISIAIYTPMLLVGAVFLAVYLWNRKFSAAIGFLFATFIGFLPGMIIDYTVFGNPFYSMIRYMGTNALILLGINPNISSLQLSQHLELAFIVIAISPLLFRLARLKFEEHKKDIIFLVIVSLIFLLRAGMLKYFLIIAPIAIILLSKVLSDKEIKFHCIVSIPIILILTILIGQSFYTYETSLQNDLTNIQEKYNPQTIVANGFDAPLIAALSWQNSPYVEWYDDYNATIENRSVIRSYKFTFTPKKIELNNILQFSASFLVPANRNYSNFTLVSVDPKAYIPGFAKEECLKEICLYKKT